MDKATADLSATYDDASSLRRIPNQRRSRERVTHILNCATQLIAESGSEGMRMSQLARRAGISIGSLYQYFSDKGAIIRTLAERYNAEGRACIEAGLADVRTPDGLLDAFADLIDEYYDMFLAEPVMRDIWSGTQADNALREIELADSRKNAAILLEALIHFPTSIERSELAASALLIMHLGEATMRLAISVDPAEGKRLVADYKRMAVTELGRLIGVRGRA